MISVCKRNRSVGTKNCYIHLEEYLYIKDNSRLRSLWIKSNNNLGMLFLKSQSTIKCYRKRYVKLDDNDRSADKSQIFPS